ncbi:hypothetical protein MTO96_005661 [Rhipicephalus appendiculatus]
MDLRPVPVRPINPPTVPLGPQSTPGRWASESAPVDSSHGECDVSVLPSVPEQEDNLAEDSSYGECDVSVLPSVPEQEGYFGVDSSHGEHDLSVGPSVPEQEDDLREAQTEDAVVRREPSARVRKKPGRFREFVM